MKSLPDNPDPELDGPQWNDVQYTISDLLSDYIIGVAGSIEAIANNELGVGSESLTEDQYVAIMRYATRNFRNGVWPERCDHIPTLVDDYVKSQPEDQAFYREVFNK